MTGHEGDGETERVRAEVIRTAGQLRAEGQQERARTHDRLADAEHALEDRLLAVADQLPDSDGTRDRGHAWSARAEEHRDRADEIRD